MWVGRSEAETLTHGKRSTRVPTSVGLKLTVACAAKRKRSSLYAYDGQLECQPAEAGSHDWREGPRGPKRRSAGKAGLWRRGGNRDVRAEEARTCSGNSSL